MRFAVLPLAVVALVSPQFLRADEADDLLARQLAAVVRDPRLTERQRTEAAKSLAKLGPKAAAAVPLLVLQLERLRGGEFPNLQEAVVDALGAAGPAARAAVPALARATDRGIDVDLAIKRATNAILSGGDDRDLAGLIEQLSSGDASLRLRAAKAIGGAGASATIALPALLLAMGDSDGDVRRAAIAAARLIQPNAKPTKELLTALAADLKDPDDAIRLQAVRALGKLGPVAAGALPVLEPLLADPDKDVRKAATEAMQRISPP